MNIAIFGERKVRLCVCRTYCVALSARLVTAPALDTHGDTEDMILELVYIRMTLIVRTSGKDWRPLVTLVDTKSRGGVGTSQYIFYFLVFSVYGFTFCSSEFIRNIFYLISNRDATSDLHAAVLCHFRKEGEWLFQVV